MPGPISDSYHLPSDPLATIIAHRLRAADLLRGDVELDSVGIIDEALNSRSNVVTCAFCGQAYPDGTPTTKHELLTEHIKTCPAHPMRKIEADRDLLHGILLEMSKWVEDAKHTNNCDSTTESWFIEWRCTCGVKELLSMAKKALNKG